ncbi:MAG: hypothetical protein HYR48_06455 [Gemmatimonadetes bacterium]|nr:hypothetical protein [Gemmatimonadota bacterium]
MKCQGGSAGLRIAWLALGVALSAGCARGRPTAAPLRIAMPTIPAGLDPHLHNEVTTFSVLGNLYEGLLTFDRDMGIRPALAVRWENPDDFTWRFHLRRGVRFHDGRPLTVADVVFSLNRARSHPQSRVANFLVAVRDVRALDSSTVELITDRPYAILLNKLTFVMIVPQDSPEEIHQPIGTAPYRFVRYDTGQRLELAAFEDYWGARAPEPLVQLVFITDVAKGVGMLLNGELDFLAYTPIEDISRVQTARCCRVASSAGLGVHYLGLGVTSRPLSDARVRRAIDLALDRQVLVDRLQGGFGRPVGQLVSPQVFGYAPDIAPVERNLVEARRLLAAAGFPRGLDLPVATSPARARHVELITAQLAEAGIRVRVVPRPWEELYRELLDRKVPFFLAGVVCLSGDASDLFDGVLHSRAAGGGYGENNFTGYTSATLDSLVEKSGQTFRMEARRPILEQAMRVAMADLPLVPLWVFQEVYAMRRNLEWQPRLNGMVFAFEMRRRRGWR